MFCWSAIGAAANTEDSLNDVVNVIVRTSALYHWPRNAVIISRYSGSAGVFLKLIPIMAFSRDHDEGGGSQGIARAFPTQLTAQEGTIFRRGHQAPLISNRKNH